MAQLGELARQGQCGAPEVFLRVELGKGSVLVAA